MDAITMLASVETVEDLLVVTLESFTPVWTLLPGSPLEEMPGCAIPISYQKEAMQCIRAQLRGEV